MTPPNWFEIDAPSPERIARRVRERLDERIERGLVDQAEITSVTDRRLPSLAVGEGAMFEAFRRLCVGWEVDRAAPIRSHRPWIGPVIVAVKRIVSRMLRFHTEVPLARQREFNRNLLVVLGEVLRHERDDTPGR